jgi:hypothetical protein
MLAGTCQSQVLREGRVPVVDFKVLAGVAVQGLCGAKSQFGSRQCSDRDLNPALKIARDSLQRICAVKV